MPSRIEIEIKAPPCLSLSSIRNEPDDWAGSSRTGLCLLLQATAECKESFSALLSFGDDLTYLYKRPQSKWRAMRFEVLFQCRNLSLGLGAVSSVIYTSYIKGRQK